MIKYNKIRYLLEQAETQSEIEVFNALDKFLKFYNDDTKVTDAVKKALSENPNSKDGLAFWRSVEKIIENISNVKGQTDESKKYISANKDAIAKNINELNSIASEHPAIYDAKFKDTFETILANPLYSGDITIPAPDVPEKPEETAASTEGETKPTGETPSTTPTAPPKSEYATGYTGVSIVDFLDQSGKPSDFASRKELATKMGIPEYRGTASQNLLMLNALRSGQKEIAVKPAEFYKAAPPPQIKFGGSKQTAYIDMGGGRYAPASEDQLGDPNVQLYVKNPTKGQGEYLKPNYVKVRREGEELRRQSKFGGVLGSLSNLAGDVGNTLAGKNREDRSTPRERQETARSYEDYPVVRPDKNYPTADRPPAKKQSKENKGVYMRNPQGVEEFFK
jgi:hypothetical protein